VLEGDGEGGPRDEKRCGGEKEGKGESGGGRVGCRVDMDLRRVEQEVW